MRKKNWLLAIATAAYSFLFYRQNAGADFLCFSVVIILLLIAENKAVLKNKTWLLFAGLCFMSGIFVFVYGSALAVFANCVSLLIVSGISLNHKSSVLLNLFSALYSTLGSLIFMIIRLQKGGDKPTKESENSLLKNLTYALTFLVVIIFFIIYKSINPLFETYTREINLDFISGAWVLFTIGGFLIVYGLLNQQRIAVVDAFERQQHLSLKNDKVQSDNPHEKKAVLVLFVLLNLMLVFINLLDINYLYLGAGLPAGITHKQFVHNGVGMLIISLLMGILIILYAFRGQLNFDSGNKFIKMLVYAWLLQNLLMVISTALRNHLYITDALLTYKRIGVYYWLFMAAAGLMTTCIKIYTIKTSWYLLRVNSSVAYLVLILSAGFDWDKIVTDYNISHTGTIAALDKKYLISISATNLKALYDIKHKTGFEIDSTYHYHSYSQYPNDQWLDEKLYEFLADHSKIDWRSYNLRNKRILNEIAALDHVHTFDTLNLKGTDVESYRPLLFLKNIKHLVMSNDAGISETTIDELNSFKGLESIRLDPIFPHSIVHLKKLLAVKTVYMSRPVEEIEKELLNTEFSFKLVFINEKVAKR